MSTVTDELLLRLAVTGGAVAAEEVAAFDERIGMAGDTAVTTGKRIGGLSNVFLSFKALLAGFTIVDAVKQFASFQRQMELLHTQAGATQGEVARMTKTVLGVAVSVATGPNSLAQALYHIESIQLRGAKAANVLRIAAEGAKVGNANLVDVTNALDAVIVGKMIPGVNNFKGAMGQLNSTTGVGDMTMQNLADAMSTGILGSMNRVGLKLIDINAALAVLGDNNIRGAQAANRLRMGLLQIVKPTNAAATEMHALHMGTLQLAKDYYKPNGLYVMLEDLHKHLDKLSKPQQNEVLMSLFGRGRNSAGIFTLYDQMDRLQNKYEGILKGQNDFNEAWAATKQTFQYTIDQLKTLGEVVLIRLGKGLEDAVTWFRRMGPIAKTVRDIAIAVGIMTVAWGAARLAVIAFDIVAAANPWVLAITAVIAIVIALINRFGGLKRVVKDFRTYWAETWANIKSDVLNAVNAVIGFTNKLISGWDKLAHVSILGVHPFSSLSVGQIPTLTASGHNEVQTSPGHYTPLYQLEQPGSASWLNHLGHPNVTPVGADMAPSITSSGADRNTTIILKLSNNKEIARTVLKEGLNATARRGAGGPTISDSGS